MKVIQDCLGHKDIETTLNIYADVTNGLRKKEFAELDRKMKDSVLEYPGSQDKSDGGGSEWILKDQVQNT